MKKVLTYLLSLVLALSVVTVTPVNALENLLQVEPVSLSVQEAKDLGMKHPQLSVGNKTELSGYLTKEQLEDSLKPEDKVRVVIELVKEPVIVIATKKGLSVDELPASEVQSIENSLVTQQNSVRQALEAANIETFDKVDGKPAANDSYTISVNAFTTYVQMKDVDAISALRNVKNVYISNEYQRPEVKVDMAASHQMIDSEVAWNQYAIKGENTVVAVIDSGIDPSHQDFRLTDETKVKLTKSDVNALGLAGLYYNAKVPYAYNYYDLSQKVTDISTDGQHGQHVAGTVAANGVIKGVAPEAQLLGMKVFSDDADYATTFSDIYLKAIDDAIALGADVLNMSLGSPAGFYVEGSIEDVALKNALENGVISTISAGNEGTIMYGSEAWANNYLTFGVPYPQAKNPDVGVVGTPSLNEASISVASIENEYQTVSQLLYTIDGVESSAAMQPATGAPDPWTLSGPQEVVTVGIGTKEQFDAVDVRGKVALVMRGSTFANTIQFAMAAGAKAAVVYNHTTGGEGMVSMAGGDTATIPFVFIGNRAGAAIAAAVNAGQQVSITFTESKTIVPNANGGLMSDFSSWGNTPMLAMKPELTAPGGMIYSTQNANTYGVMSGTSMAAPHAAGGSALVQQHLLTSDLFSALNLTAQERALLAKTLLMNTATTVLDKYGYPYLVRSQGAGLMNLANALETKVYVQHSETNKPKVEFGDTTSTTLSTSLTLTNVSDTNLTYSISSEMLTDYVTVGTAEGHLFNLLSSDFVAHTLTSEKSVTVPAHGSVTIPVTLDYSQAGLAPNSYVEGFIYFTSEDSEVGLTVPYLGFYGDWDALRIMDEYRWNVKDGNNDNDPTFMLTTATRRDAEGTLYFVDSLTSEIFINPGNTEFAEYYGTGSIGFMGTVLRNIEEANFRVLDSTGKVVREVGQQSAVRKAYRLRTSYPFTFFSTGLWDGHLDGAPVQDGEVYTYQVELLRTSTSTPQVHNFKVQVDNTNPTLSNLSYDAKTYTLSFDSTDSGSGLDYFGVINLANTAKRILGGTNPGQEPALVGDDSVIRYSVNVQSILEVDRAVPFILVGYDKIGNEVATRFTLPPLQEKDVVAGAPKLNEVTTESTTVTGVTRPGYSIVVSLNDVALDPVVADSVGAFSVAIEPQAEGTVVTATSTNPASEAVSPVAKTTVVYLHNSVVLNVLVDGQPATQDLSSTTFKLIGPMSVDLVHSTESPLTLSASEVKTGNYKVEATNLPDGLYLVAHNSIAVSQELTEPVELHLTTKEPTVVTPPEKEEGPYGQGQISIATPGLLEAYKDANVSFSGKVYGFETVQNQEIRVGSEQYGGVHALDLTLNPKTSVINGAGVEVFYGNVFTFEDTINLADNYYEYPFSATNHLDQSVQVARRFWVDTQAPTITVTVLERDSNSSTAQIQIDTADNMSVLEIMRGDDYVNAHDWTDKGFDARNVVGQDVDLVELVDGLNTFTYSVTDIAGNTTSVSVEVMKVDKSILNALLNALSLLPEKSDALQKAYDEAVAISKNPVATQEEVDVAVAKLYEALDPNSPINQGPVISGVSDHTVYVGDVVDLRANVSASDAQDGDLTAHILISPETVDTSVVGETTVTYSVVDADGNTSSVSVKVIVLDRPVVNVVKVALKVALEIAHDQLATDLQDAYRTRLQAAVDAAQLVYDDPNATQEQVDAATQALVDALNPATPVNVKPTLSGVKDLVVNQNDSLNLLDGVSASDAQDGDLTSQIVVTPSTVDTSVLQEVVVTYSVTDSDGNTTSQEALVKVVESNVVVDPVVDLTALQAKVDEALAIDTTDYTQSSKDALAEALTHAQAVLVTENPTQALVDDALAALVFAIENLEVNQPENPGDPGEPPVNPNNPPVSLTVTAPSDVDYSQGQTLNVEGGSVSVTYKDGSTSVVALTLAMTSGSDFSGSTYGKQTVTVTYQGLSSSFDVWYNRFSDIAHDHWAFVTIENTAQLGIVKGYEDGTFRPNAQVTRAEAVVMLVRSLNETVPVAQSSTFSDISESHWAVNEIMFAVEKGIISGSVDTFRPNDKVTRGELAKMVSVTYDLKVNSENLKSFSDIPTTHWAYDYIQALASNNVVSGFEDGTYGASKNVTRAEFTKFISNALSVNP